MERVFVIQQESSSVSADVKRLTAQHRARTYFFDGVRTVGSLHKKLYSSASRRIPKVAKSYWVIRRSSKLNLASLGQRC